MCCLTVSSISPSNFWKNSRNSKRSHEISEFKHNQYSTYHAIHINYIKTNNNSPNLDILAQKTTLEFPFDVSNVTPEDFSLSLSLILPLIPISTLLLIGLMVNINTHLMIIELLFMVVFQPSWLPFFYD